MPGRGRKVLLADEVHAEVAVVGAGVAGICAAVAAAHHGASTVLVTDRPVLGGNCSGEVGVPMSGSAYSRFNLWSRETGIVEEIRNRMSACWSGSEDSYWTVADRVYFDLVAAEKNLRLLLNTTVTEVAAGPDGRISSVEGVQLRAERKYKVSAEFFIDCTGDGTVGGLAGADSRQGREAGSEFGESMAPEVAEPYGTMGATLLWRSKDLGRAVKFTAPEWAIDVSKLEPFVNPGRDPTRRLYRADGDGEFYGFWWSEYGGELDTITDDQEVQRHLRRLVYGIWDWIKNSGKIRDVENHELVWVGALPGKRESRRLLGPVILTENTWRTQERFDDAIGYAGWPIDVHPPKGYLDKEPGCTHVWLSGPSDIPFRALYSRNIPNLLFAGRDISATHIGLGTPRVIATTGVMGQAVGTAAAICIEQDKTPSQFDQSDVASLQDILLRNDQGIMGHSISAKGDLAGSARVTASSVRRFELLEGTKAISLDPRGWSHRHGGVVAIIPAPDYVESIELRFAGKAGKRVVGELYLTDRPENYRLDTKIGEPAAELDNAGWAEFGVGCDPGEGKKFLLFFPPQDGPALMADKLLLPGAAAAGLREKPGESVRAFLPCPEALNPCFRMTPEQRLLSEQNVTDGHIRPYGLPHLWMSDAMRAGEAQWIEFSWEKPVRASRVEIVFDSQLDGENKKLRVSGALVREYEIAGETMSGDRVQLLLCRDNTLRFRAHIFEPVELRALRITILATHGSAWAAIYAVRVYE